MKTLFHIARFILSVVIINTASAQVIYKPSYNDLKRYQGVYEFTNHTTLQIAASPKDSMLYALIGDSRYKLRPFSVDVFLNNGNEQVQFIRNGDKIEGFKQQNDKPGTIYKLISTNVTFSDKMWYARQLKGSPFVYHYNVPQKKNDGLQTGSIINSGLDTALIHTLVNRVVDGTYPNIHSVLIVKNGKLVFEEYFYEYDDKKSHELRSASKSFTSALVGIAIDKGLIKSINDPMISYLPGYNYNNPDPRKKAITIKNLLTQQSGLACYDYDPKSPGNEVKMYPTKDWIKFMLDLPMAGDPGKAAFYCSGNVMLLDRIVENVSHQSLHDFARENLFDKLGISDFKLDFVPDYTHEDDYGQVRLTSRDMAKFGLLYLNDGVWGGKQIISQEYVRQSLSKHSVVDDLNYGYLWWCEDLTANGIVYKGIAAKGNGGQRIFIWPEQNMVAVITAGNYNTQSPANKLLIDCVLGGLK
ncbi:serine hydrolase domain-containing protein [Mucilaginibacter sp. X5P1]|uniref:serine hydrolase domain-containing protein n=1 Tax=Mucilaginibacter sp. X5P1 TaxID=2723088 RepID=UPI0016216E12|nr:serine hydrolase [Mucilaginibacter sp. X5P1]MBB6139321.1 CubicO group peptidase (beta-lactamase class C family) [Mucilaginibacter sp. X5P1]